MPVDEAVKKADMILVTLPDEVQPGVYEKSIAPHLRAGQTLCFTHGFNVHFKTIVPPKDVNVIMVAPKGPGHLVRSEPERHCRGVGPGPPGRTRGQRAERGLRRRGVETEGERRRKPRGDRRAGRELLVVGSRRRAPLPEHRRLERRKLPAALHASLERHQGLTLVPGVGLCIAGQHRREHDGERRCGALHG